MFDNEKGPVAKRVPRAAENAAGLTLLCSLSLSLLGMKVAIRGALTTQLNKLCVALLANSEMHLVCFLIPQIYLNFS